MRAVGAKSLREGESSSPPPPKRAAPDLIQAPQPVLDVLGMSARDLTVRVAIKTSIILSRASTEPFRLLTTEPMEATLSASMIAVPTRKGLASTVPCPFMTDDKDKPLLRSAATGAVLAAERFARCGDQTLWSHGTVTFARVTTVGSITDEELQFLAAAALRTQFFLARAPVVYTAVVHTWLTDAIGYLRTMSATLTATHVPERAMLTRSVLSPNTYLYSTRNPTTHARAVRTLTLPTPEEPVTNIRAPEGEVGDGCLPALLTLPMPPPPGSDADAADVADAAALMDIATVAAERGSSPPREKKTRSKHKERAT
jgi:hypothetical protein